MDSKVSTYEVQYASDDDDEHQANNSRNHV